MSLAILNAQSGPVACSTEGDANSVGCEAILHSMDEKGPFFVKIYVHAIRKNDGSGGQSLQEIEEALGYLDLAFNEQDIYFVWDCEVDEIKNSDLYVKVDPGKNIFTDPNNNPNPDGIDIYLFPDHPSPNAKGAGLAENYGGTALYVTGNYSLPPYGSRVRSHVLSHEMGHCLGLLHTHHYTDGNPKDPTTGYEIALQHKDPGNCLEAGDCVCDTPADPDIYYEVIYPACSWTGYGEDINGDPFTPSIENIMSYTHDNCYKKFTDGQGKRMRNVIAYLPELQDCLVREVISTTTTWDLDNTPGGVVEIDGTLEIEPGTTLTIESGITVRFGRQSRLIIKPDATLILKGTLTSNPCSTSCTETGICGDTWKGVEVWGNSSIHQYKINGQRAQGQFVGVSGSLVENAEIAVQLWGLDKDFDSGGLINCHETIFKNNRIGIDFFNYKNWNPNSGQPVGYFGYFTGCKFITDENYPHEENFATFVNMVDVNGPRFTGCSFVNTYTPITLDYISAYGFGIYAFNSSFRVEAECNTPIPCTNYTRSEFKGLGYGIFTGTFGAMTAPFTVRQADFEDCFVGIHNLGITGGTIILNDFNLGNLPTLDLITDQIGISLNDIIAGMTLEENDFNQVDGDESIRTIGISSFGLGASNKVIRRNEFTGVNVGNEAGGTCGDDVKGLSYECNFNTGNTEYDFLVCDSEFSDTDRIRKDQIGPGNAATGNRFSNSGSPTDRDFSNQGGYLLDYYHKINGGILEIPDEYSGIDNLIEITENPCPITYCDPPCKTLAEVALLKQGFYIQRDSFQIFYADYEAASSVVDTILAASNLFKAANHRRQMDENAYMVLVHAMYDTLTWNRDTLRTWLSNMDYYETELMLAFDYLHTGESQAGFAVLNGAPAKFDLTPAQISDSSHVRLLFNILSQQSLYDLNDDALEQLDTIAQSHGEYSSGISKNILTLYGRYFYPENCTHGTELRNPQKEEEPGFTGSGSGLLVYPNPAKEQVTFERLAHESNKAAKLILTDITGKVVWQQQFKEGVLKTIWHSSNMPGGIYFYRLVEFDGTSWSGRVVLQK